MCCRAETFRGACTLSAGFPEGCTMADVAAATVLGPHGAKGLPSVEVDSYNLELKDDEGFLGDRASRQAFHAILENWRKPLRKLGEDPFGEKHSDDLSRTKLDVVLKEGDAEAAAVIQSAIEDYAQELALVVRRFLKAKAWADTERIAMGGGFRDSRIAKGAQNLPGNWESSRFNLPARLAEAFPTTDDHDVTILMHNDAVVQGLSEIPYMQDVKRWGVLTIGTGLGNARFTNRAGSGGKESGGKDKE